MTQYPWQEFLEEWSAELRVRFPEDLYKRDTVPVDLSQPLWIGYPGATLDQIIQAETRLGCTFPPSYRQFLQVTNGLRQIWSAPYCLVQIWPVDHVEWFRISNKDMDYWVRNLTQGYKPIADAQYFDYDNLKVLGVRKDHLLATLEIGGFDRNEYYVLNPLAITANGEWEAWMFDGESGTARYPSFWDMLQSLCKDFPASENTFWDP